MEKKLAEIIARMKKVNEDQQGIERDAALNSEGVFTDEQRSQYEALDSMYADLEKQKESIEKQMALMASRNNRADSLAPFSLRKTPANSGAPITQPVGQSIDNQVADPGHQHKFTMNASVRRFTPQHFNGDKNGFSAEERAYRFGMWALATLTRTMPGNYNFESAVRFVDAHIAPTNTAHSESDATTGGHFLVPEEFSRDLIDLREQYGLARRLFRREPMMSDTKNVPKRTSGVTAYFVAENATGTESNMTWANLKLVAKKMVAMARMSNEFSADAAISVGDTLAGELGYSFAYMEDLCAFNGDGTSTYGGINGVRNLLTSADGAGTNSAGLVSSGTSNTWDAMVLGDFNNTIGKLPEYADTNNTVWVCHRTFYYSVMQRLEAAAGGNTMFDISQGNRRPRPMFLGYPVEFSQVFPSATAASTVSAVLGDFKAGALFGDRTGTTIRFSEDATVGGESVFERDQVAVRGTERFDIVVHGTGTTSVVGPIVGLETDAS